MLAFQLLLLAGYGYAHFCAGLPSRTQAVVHGGFLVGAAAFVWHVHTFGAPSLASRRTELAVPWLVVTRVGVPYVALASTAPLMQRWSARATGRSPYYLYALSNVGALGGLLAYPFIIEPRVEVPGQLAAWSIAFVAFAVLTFPACAVALRAATVPLAPHRDPPHIRTTWRSRMWWIAWSFVPSALLLAATNHITVDVAATPLLWVVPLALYLGSFVVAFSAARDAVQGTALVIFVLGAVGVGTNAYVQGSASLARQVSPTLLALLGGTLVCHGALSRNRPPAQELSGYYLAIALGGALGGVFVSVFAPLVFTDYFELELSALAVFALLLLGARSQKPAPMPRAHRIVLMLGTGVGVPLLVASLVTRLSPPPSQGVLVERKRSFLGPVRVIDLPGRRILTHGRIQHGMQLTRPEERREPTMYFGPNTGLSLTMLRTQLERARHVGVIGLGVGTIAAYGRAGDRFRFYELDPNVVEIANRDFSYLGDSLARIETVCGDGRLALAREPAQGFDVLVLDAFTSDAVPMHLLTREAFAVYARHLGADGVLLANVSNRHLAVDRVVVASAQSKGFSVALVETPSDPAHHVTHVKWALLARKPEVLATILAGVPRLPLPEGVPWTDTRASILGIALP
jgi:hypothetical protein